MTAAFQEPYGLALRGSGTGSAYRPLYDKLPEGVNHITVITDHPEWVTIRVSPQKAWENLLILGRIPPGEGYRSITMTYSVGAGEDWYLSINGTGTVEVTERASATVVTIPLKEVVE